jgi:hypothetical protein
MRLQSNKHHVTKNTLTNLHGSVRRHANGDYESEAFTEEETLRIYRVINITHLQSKKHYAFTEYTHHAFTEYTHHALEKD